MNLIIIFKKNYDCYVKFFGNYDLDGIMYV